MTTNKLDLIIQQKQLEVSELTQQNIQPRISSKNFKHALRSDTLSIIAEVKRKSPSKGNLAEILDPVLLAENYINANASAISVLTDCKFFGGSLNDLEKIAEHSKSTPVLRKDFIISPLQIDEAVGAGADAILLIVAVLGEKTKSLLDYAKKLNIDVLLEIHNHAELSIALESNADIIGINNRNLSTFEVDTQEAFNLKKLIPSTVITVAESGILQPELAREYYKAGFDAVLIGEALVTSTNPTEFIRACRHE